MTHQRIHSGAPWEPVVGYCRVVVAGPVVAISGSTAVDDDGQVVGIGDMYAQTVQCLKVIESALAAANCSLADVIRTRMFVTDIDAWKEVARAHQQTFGDAPPATSMIGVDRLIDQRMLIEVEADAYRA